MEFKQLQTSMNRVVNIISNNIDAKLKKSLGDNYISENPFKINNVKTIKNADVIIVVISICSLLI